MPSSFKFEDIIYGFKGEFAPCFYDWIRHLVRVKQLEVSRFPLPNITQVQESEVQKRARDVIARARDHYVGVCPQICFALHQKGYEYSRMIAEAPFLGGKADILAVPCEKWRVCKKKILCKNCEEWNGLGFIPVEIGSLSFPSKIFATRILKDITEIWLHPQVARAHDFVYVFIAKKSKHEAWKWLWKRLEEIAEREVAKDGGWSVISGGGCSNYPECYLDYDNKPCKNHIEGQRRAKKRKSP